MSSRPLATDPPLPPKETLPTMYDLPDEEVGQPVATDPPLPPKETLPTMYDLPDEEVGQSGMPDEFHLWQPRLLEETFRPANFSEAEIFIGSDINLYYDVHHPRRNKRPDWFAAVGLPVQEKREMRLSYVTWQEGVNPFLIVELLSPGTEKEDLGQTLREVKSGAEPTKWEVYEQYLRVPYYVTFSRYTSEARVFELRGGRFSEVTDHQGRFWMPGLELGLGLWHGTYHGEDRLWLRFYDAQGNWVPTPLELQQQVAERARQETEAERVKAELAQQEAEAERLEKEKALEKAARLAAQLKALGIDPDQE